MKFLYDEKFKVYYVVGDAPVDGKYPYKMIGGKGYDSPLLDPWDGYLYIEKDRYEKTGHEYVEISNIPTKILKGLIRGCLRGSKMRKLI